MTRPASIRGAIPPGVSVPLHSHTEPETFVALSGTVEGLVRADWVRVGAGDLFHVPGGVPHAWRNRGGEPAKTLVVTATRIARFFSEVGTPVAPGSAGSGPPSPEAIARFLEVANRYGYWNATPEQNAAVGIALG